MTRGMHARLGGSVVVAVLLLAGTFWGDDDNFPFGPFRMYSTKQGLDGEVRVAEVEGFTEEGVWVPLSFNDFGVRRADIEGQLGMLAQPPEKILAAMAVAYERFDRGKVEIRALRLLQRTVELEDGVAVGEHTEAIATWRG